MSGQKYKRTNFDDDDNMSTGGTPPGVTYDPAIAFKAGASFWQKRSILERLLLFLTIALSVVVVILGALLGSRGPAGPVSPHGSSGATSTQPPTYKPITLPPKKGKSY